jgi:methyl-accepting chemotaxis protein
LKKTVMKTLTAFSSLLVSVFVGVVILFAAVIIIDSALQADSRTLEGVIVAMERMLYEGGLLALANGPDDLRARLSEMTREDSLLQSTLPSRAFPYTGLLISESSKSKGMRALTELRSGYHEQLGELSQSSDPAVAAETKAGFSHAFLDKTESLLADLGFLSSGISEARLLARRVASAALILLAVIGLALAGLLFHGFARLRKNLGALVAFSRSDSGAAIEHQPNLDGDDELGELLNRLRTLSAVETGFKDLHSASLRLVGGFRRFQNDIGRMRESLRGQARFAEAAGVVFAGINLSVGTVAQEAGSSLVKATTGGSELEKSMEKVRQGIEEIRTLEERSSRIEEVIALIGEVAEQTELLSLNAAIEAARAGEAGKGFSLVAQQVRKLSDRSAKAASEISDLIGGVLEAARTVTSSARESFPTMAAIHTDLASLCASLKNVANLASDTTRSAGQIGTSLDSLLSLSAQGSRDAEESMTSLEMMEKSAREIQRIAASVPESIIGKAEEISELESVED